MENNKMYYSSELAENYSNAKEKFSETDKDLLSALESIGVKEKEVLDLGCGDGRHARLINAMGAKSVIGIDINESMIALAQKSTSPEEKVTFLVSNGRNIPIEDNSKDLIVSNFVIHYFHDTQEVFQEIGRVLKPNGIFIGTFNITDVEEGYEHLFNTEMPIRLGGVEDNVVVQNLIKSRNEIENAISSAGLFIKEEKELDHPNAVIDDAFPFKDQLKKHAVMMILEKIRQ